MTKFPFMNRKQNTPSASRSTRSMSRWATARYPNSSVRKDGQTQIQNTKNAINHSISQTAMAAKQIYILTHRIAVISARSARLKTTCTSWRLSVWTAHARMENVPTMMSITILIATAISTTQQEMAVKSIYLVTGTIAVLVVTHAQKLKSVIAVHAAMERISPRTKSNRIPVATDWSNTDNVFPGL